MDEITAFKKLKRRQRDAAELLWGDGRLREGLTDEQADRLLTWAADYAHGRLTETITLPDREAEAFADDLLAQLRRLLRRLVRLATKSVPSPNDIKALADDWVGLTGRELAGNDSLTSQIQLNPVQSFDILMAALISDPEEE